MDKEKAMMIQQCYDYFRLVTIVVFIGILMLLAL